jgi:HD-GYP domain-containing protein (c-di-GMP phosphodiesterase class II)
VSDVVSRHSLSADSCSCLARRLVRDDPSEGLFRGPSGDLGETDPPLFTPVSLALVVLDANRGSWVGVLSLDPGSELEPGDLTAIREIMHLAQERSRRKRVQERLRETLFGIVRCLSGVIDSKDPYTIGHSERVARIAVRLGREMGLAGSALSDLYLAALLHDVGKMGIRDEILFKPGPLSSAEFAQVRDHPVAGAAVVAQVKPLAYLCPVIRGHHERYDGTGYPDGLKGKSIPLLARIVAVADSCVAMMSSRPYRPALAAARIERIFTDGAGGQWDPDVIRTFMSCCEELYDMFHCAASVSFPGDGDSMPENGLPHDS